MPPDKGINGESPRRFVVNSVPAGCPPLIAPCEVDAAARARRGMDEPRQKPPGPNGVTHPQALRSPQRRGAPSPVFVPAASAGPLEARKRLAFVATCDDGDTVQVVVNGEGGARFRPRCAARRRSSFRRAFDTVEFTPTGGTTEAETDTSSKPHLHGDFLTSSFHVTRSSHSAPSTFSRRRPASLRRRRNRSFPLA